MKATRDALKDVLPLMGDKYENIVVLDADLGGATKLGAFKEKHPNRFFQLGIAEANMIGVASGLSEYGRKVFLGSFASFLTGRYDYIRCGLALPNCPVVLVGTHVGLAPSYDGVTQEGLEDVGLMRGLPNMKVLNPATYSEAVEIIEYLCSTELDGPHYLRLGRQPVEDVLAESKKSFEFGKARIVQDDVDFCLMTTGCILPDVLKASKTIEQETSGGCRVVHFPTLKPIDKEIIIECAKEYGQLFTIEDHSVIGGLGSIVCEVVAEQYPVPVTRIGLNDVFPESGNPKDVYEKYGLSYNKIADRILEKLI